MRRIISKLFYVLIICLVLLIQVLPNFTYAGDFDTLQDNGDNLEDLSPEGPYSVRNAAEDIVTDSGFELWMDMMISYVKNANGGKVIETSGSAAMKIVNSSTKKTPETRNDYLGRAKLAMQKMEGDITTIGQLETFLATDYDIKFGISNIFTMEDIAVINITELAKKAGLDWSIGKDSAEKVRDRIFLYRQKLIDNFGKKGIGDVGPYITSAMCTYNAALAAFDNNSDFNAEKGTAIKWDADTINSYIDLYGYNFFRQGDKNELQIAWCDTLGLDKIYTGNNFGTSVEASKKAKFRQYVSNRMIKKTEKYFGKTIDELNQMDEETQNEDIIKEDPDKDTIFQQPKNITAVAKNGVEDLISDADKIFEDGKDVNEYIATENLEEFSQTLYSILFGIGIIVAVIVGIIIGIKLMLSPVEQRAEAKKLLVPYVAGCIVVFGAFGIWKIVVTMMEQI